MSKLTEDLDTTITAAVKAQIEARVLEALSGGAFFEKYVQSALYATVEVPDPKNAYGKVKVSFLDHALSKVIRSATQAAIAVAVEEQRERIQDEVRKAVKRHADEFAESVTAGLLEQAQRGFGYTFEVKMGVRQQG